MKKPILILFLLLSATLAKPQDSASCSNLKLKINVSQTALLELALNAQYNFNNKYEIDLKGGYCLNTIFEDIPPGTVWQAGFKKYHKNKTIKKRKVFKYSGLFLMYQNFTKEEEYKHYSDTRVYTKLYDIYTLKALAGSETFYRNFIIDFYYGFGFRYQTEFTSDIVISTPAYGESLYGRTEINYYPTLHFGINIGFNIPLKKIKK